MFDKKILKELKQRLLEERQKVLVQLSGDKEKFGDLSKNEVGDMADIAFNMYERDLTIEMSENEKKILQAIEGALIRLQNNKYGTCSQCGREIDIRRLKALPWTTRCADTKTCKKISDAKKNL